MRLSDVGAHALSNLARHKLRTALTLAGVGVGVATLTVMVSLGAGLQRLVEDQFDKAELVTRITVYPKGSLGRMLRGIQPVDAGQRRVLDDEAVAALAKLPGVLDAWPEHLSFLLGDFAERGAVFPSQTEALPTKAIGRTHTDALRAGRYWTAAEEEGAVVVAPTSIVRDDLGLTPEQAIGKRVAFTKFGNIRRYKVERTAPPAGATESPAGPPLPPPPPGPEGLGPFDLERGPGTRYIRPPELDVLEVEIVGVYDSREFGLAGDRFHCPLALARRLSKQSGMGGMGLGGPIPTGQYRSITVKVQSRKEVAPTRAAIDAQGFETLTVDDLLKGISVFFAVIELLLGFFGGIGLVVSFFGIANTMVMAVLERTREIGVLKAIGARDRDVRRVFVAEAAAIGACGGTLGVGAGWVVGLALNAVASHLLREQLGRDVAVFYVPAWLATAGIGISVLVATVAGLYPAWRAARLDPVESLRAE